MKQNEFELFVNKIVALEGEAHDMVESCEPDSKAQGKWIDIRAKLREAIDECRNR